MKYVVSGGTGFLGTPLVDRLSAEGHTVILLTRAGRRESRPGVRVVQWDGTDSGPWTPEADGADAFINLAGEPMGGGRWSPLRKKKILQSRIDATRAFVGAARWAARRPGVLVNASGAGYYGDVPEGDVAEERKPGTGFVADVCRQWEEEALKARDLGLRVALMRMGVVLGEGGGALAKMLLPFRLFVGGPPGSGEQWFPWIHRDDAVGAILHALGTPGLEGPVNVAAPEAVTMRQFCLALGNAMQRPSRMRVPAPVLRVIFGEMADMVLTGQKVVPRKLVATGYTFRYSNVLDALEDVFR